MITIIVILHILVSIALILIVLLQTGKGADMGAAFGGGSSQTLFGSSGPGGFLSKATTAAAVIFMLTSLGLAYMTGKPAVSESIVTESAPIESTQPAALDTTAPATSQPAQPEKSE
jgi:preprotein translocase subunit SecG